MNGQLASLRWRSSGDELAVEAAVLDEEVVN
jgi:hypothetical protein